MNFEDLSPELKEKALACKTSEELIVLAQAEGIELSDEDLEGSPAAGADGSARRPTGTKLSP